MLAINRFRVPSRAAEDFATHAAALLKLLSEAPGLVSAELGESMDEPGLHVLVTRWESVGRYRRTLGRVDIRMHLLPMSMHSIDEPGAFELSARITDGHVQTLWRDTASAPWASAREDTHGDWVG
jgi:hypothetical protein